MTPALAFRRLTDHLRDFGPVSALRTCAESLLRPLSADAAVRMRGRWIRQQSRRFDRLHGTSTADPYDPSVPEGGQPYEPTDEAALAWFLRRIDIPAERYTFLDIGSGRGKVALLAAQAGFRQVIGIEYDPALLRAAEANLEVYRHRSRPGHDRIRFVHADATRIEPPNDDLVIWSFNPFDAAVLARMLDRFESSWRVCPRDFVFGYYNALYPEVFERPWLTCVIPGTPLLIGHLTAFRSLPPSAG